MTIELFSASSYEAIWTTKSDVWVILNPDDNQWTEKLDWHFGLLLRRSLFRISQKRKSNLESSAKKVEDAILLATPEGLPTARVLVLNTGGDQSSKWLENLGAHLSGLKIRTATVFPPRNWRPPHPKQLADISQGDWGIRWVDSIN